MVRSVFVAGALLVGLAGCAKVPMQDSIESDMAKSFAEPASDKSGVYIYRKTVLGSALKKDVWVDNNCVGQTAPKVFFYLEVEGDREHQFTTLSEFSPNHLNLFTEGGKNYFIEQKIKLGVFVGGAKLVEVNPETGMRDLKALSIAQQGNCRRPSP